ncbi:MAG: DNA repair protein RecO [Planctomycetota bacterium]|jgi:DNA repair protein RecO (recombination protein O)
MTRLQDQALVLRRWDYSETSQTVALYTRHHGLLRGLAKGAKRPRATFSGGFEPVTGGQIQAIPKADSDLAILTEWDLQEIFPSIRRSLAAHRWGVCSADLVFRMLERDDPHPLLFDALESFWRDLGTRVELAGVLGFLLALLRETGHLPDFESLDALSTDTPTLGFNPVEGRFTMDPGPDVAQDPTWRIRTPTALVLQRFAKSSQTDPTGQDLVRAIRFSLTCLCWTLGSEPDSVRLIMSTLPRSG